MFYYIESFFKSENGVSGILWKRYCADTIRKCRLTYPFAEGGIYLWRFAGDYFQRIGDAIGRYLIDVIYTASVESHLINMVASPI